MRRSSAATLSSWLTFAAILVCSLAAAFAASVGDVYIGVLVGVILLFLAVSRPREGAILALILGLLQYGPTKTIPLFPHSFTLVDDLLLLGVGVRLLLDALQKQYRPPLWVLGWVGAWALAGALGAVMNGVDFTTVLSSYRWMFLPVVLYVASSRYGGQRRFAALVVGVVIANTLAQAVLAVVQALGARQIGDTSFGLLGPGGANLLGFVLLIGVSLLAAGVGRPAMRMGGVALGLLGIVCSAARAAMVAAPFALLAGQRGLLRRPSRIAAIVAFVVVGMLASAILFGTMGMSLATGLSPSRVLAAQYDSHSGGRLIYARGLSTVLEGDPLSWAVGLGPGQYTSVVGQQYAAPAFVRVRIREAVTSRYATPDIEWVTVMGEYGAFGITCLLAVLIRPLWLGRLPSQRLLESDGSALAMVTRAAPSLVIIALVGSLSNNFFEYQPASYGWWAVLGLVEAANYVRSGV